MTDFSIEKSIGEPVIGLDEVGRGPLAGPVVSCGCYFSNYDDLESEIPITDSKKHTAKQRKQRLVQSGHRRFQNANDANWYR